MSFTIPGLLRDDHYRFIFSESEADDHGDLAGAFWADEKKLFECLTACGRRKNSVETVPQRLKPRSFLRRYGTTKVVPFQIQTFATAANTTVVFGIGGPGPGLKAALLGPCSGG